MACLHAVFSFLETLYFALCLNDQSQLHVRIKLPEFGNKLRSTISFRQENVLVIARCKTRKNKTCFLLKTKLIFFQ